MIHFQHFKYNITYKNYFLTCYLEILKAFVMSYFEFTVMVKLNKIGKPLSARKIPVMSSRS